MMEDLRIEEADKINDNRLETWDFYYNSLNTDTEKSDYVKITAQALKVATEKAYNEDYKDKDDKRKPFVSIM